MAWPDLQAVLDNCHKMASRFQRIPNFFITGGDPLLHPDFWRLLGLLKSSKTDFSILGNPFHLTPEICARLADAGCERFQLSLDGLAETHDWLRMPGSFQATLAALPMLKRAGIETAIMATVSSRNIAEIPAVLQTAVAHHADVFAFARYCPPGFANDIQPRAYRDLLRKCREIDCGETYLSQKDHLWTLLDWEEGRFEIPGDARPGMIYDGCNCGNCHLTILPDGDVLACRRIPGAVVGNALADDLAGLWLNEMEKYREFSSFRKCASCELLAWCRGCPAVAASPDGDFYAPDPQCWREL